MAAHAGGAVELADGHPGAAVTQLRRAARLWQRVEAPYHAALAQTLLGAACRALGDDDGAAWELDAARSVFGRLGATPDLARLDTVRGGAPAPTHRPEPA